MSKIIRFFKEYKKGAIIGGIIYPVVLWYLGSSSMLVPGTNQIIKIIYSIIFAPISLLSIPLAKLWCGSGCQGEFGGFAQAIVVSLFISIIFGFIIGALIQKLWRKHFR